MASKYYGYTGKILYVNLTTGETGEYELSDRDRELFLGGRYLSTKILWDCIKPGIDPLSEENILVVMTSPLTGTGAPCTSRYDISAKSPLTGAIGHSNSGGNFGIHLKRAGWDAVIVRGKSKKPVYLDITDNSVTVKSAAKLWGMDTHKSQEALARGKKNCGTMTIGPGGENLVKFASVVSQERSHGRTGMGAVMGSKNLKGMVAMGSHRPELYQKDKFRETVKKWTALLQKHPATGDMTPRLGTAFSVLPLSLRNALPTKNFQMGTFDGAYNISGERLADEFLVKNYGCQSCPIRCGRVVNIDGKEVKGPEYEILCLMGSNLMIDDLEAIIRWNYELDLLGLDSITTGTTLGFAAELNEKGIWKSGVEFGKSTNISKILNDIAYKQGRGKDLAEGVRFLAKKYGGSDFAPEVKGLEIAGYSPRGSIGQALGYATANRGACHLDAGYMVYLEVTGPATLRQFNHRAKPSWTALDQNLLAVISAGGNCLFTSWTFIPPIAYRLPGHRVLSAIISWILTASAPVVTGLLKMPPWMMGFHLSFLLPHSKALKEATGIKMDSGRWFKAGDRGYNMERLFNLREGIDKEQDRLAKRFTEDPLIPDNKKSVVHLNKMIPKYYRVRGWDKDGYPKKRTLKKMGLDFVDIDGLKNDNRNRSN